MQKTVTGFLLKYLNNLVPLSTEIPTNLTLENIFKLRKQASMRKKLGTPSQPSPQKENDVATSSREQGPQPTTRVPATRQPGQKLPLPHTKNHVSHSPALVP